MATKVQREYSMDQIKAQVAKPMSQVIAERNVSLKPEGKIITPVSTSAKAAADLANKKAAFSDMQAANALQASNLSKQKLLDQQSRMMQDKTVQDQKNIQAEIDRKNKEVELKNKALGLSAEAPQTTTQQAPVEAVQQPAQTVQGTPTQGQPSTPQPTPVTGEVIGGQPQTNVEAINTNLQGIAEEKAGALGQIQDTRDQLADKVNKQLNSVLKGTFPLTGPQQSLITSLQSQLAQNREDQKLANKSFEGATAQAGFRSGGEYTPEQYAGQIANAVSVGVAKIQALDNAAAQTIAELEDGWRKDNFDMINDNYATLEKQLDDKATSIKDMFDTVSKTLTDQRDQQVKQQEDRNKIADIAAKNGASPAVIAAISNAPTHAAALASAGRYLQSESELLDVQYKKAQISKIYNDMKESAANGGMDAAQIMGYAAQYAQTGQIPAGIPKGSFGLISQVAKEVPKQKGQILSSTTGVSPTGSEELQKSLGSLSSAIDLANELKELDKERWGGLVSGTVGKVVGSADQQRYVDLREQVVDLLSRARSGAALTANEEERYKNMLPGRFDEPLGFGADSDVRIDNFVNTLTRDLTNKAGSQGWVINGISKVKLGDQEYTVGDVVDNGEGKQARINADGSVTYLN